MSVFEYSGVDQKRKKVSGIIDADNVKTARLRLRRMGIYPEKVTLEGGSKKRISLRTEIDFSKYFQRIKTQDIAVMTRQISTLLNAGIPLVDSLTAVIDQVDNVRLRKIVTEVREKVTEGTKLSDSLRHYPKIFNNLFVNMVNAGENSGTLDIVMLRLADFTESQSALRSKIIGAMIYPIIMSIVGCALMVMLLTFVVPKVTAIFEGMDATLPLPTRVLIAVSNGLISYWYVVVLVIPLIIYGVRRWINTPKGREWYDTKILRMPIFGNLIRLVAISRFSRTLSTLLSSGVPLLTSMDIVSNIITNVKICKAIRDTRTSVQEGASVAEPLKKSGEFPPIVTHMIAIGERTGDLEKMLERVANSYDTQVSNTVSTLTTLLEPIMILVMAGVVSFIVMSILLPILQLNQLAT